MSILPACTAAPGRARALPSLIRQTRTAPQGASAPTLADPGTYIPVTGATSSAAEIVDPAGTYSAAVASAPATDPAGTYSRASARAPTLAAAGTYISVTGATSAAAEIASPAGTYSSAGASAPIADPGARTARWRQRADDRPGGHVQQPLYARSPVSRRQRFQFRSIRPYRLVVKRRWRIFSALRAQKRPYPPIF